MITTFSGYTGASLWGAVIYLMVSRLPRWASIGTIFLLLAFTGFTFIFVRNISTALILLLLFGGLFLIWKFREQTWARISSQFIGIYTMTVSIYSPYYLFYSETGDHVSMSQHTGIPSVIWIFIWIAFSLTLFLLVLRNTWNGAKKRSLSRLQSPFN